MFASLFLADDRHRLVTVVQAFCDGSSARRRLAVASLMAPVEDWGPFSEKWRGILAESGVAIFHMTEYMARRTAPYKDWSDVQHTEFGGRLLAAIAETVWFGFGGIMLMDDYQAIPKPTRMFYVKDNPFAMCANACLAMNAHRLDETGLGGESIGYVFEIGDKGLPAFHKAVEGLTRSVRQYRDEFHIRSITTMGKQDAAPLQAADLVAWELSHLTPNESKPILSHNLQYLRKRFQMAVFYLNQANLAAIADGATPEKIAQFGWEYGARRQQRKRHGKE